MTNNGLLNITEPGKNGLWIESVLNNNGSINISDYNFQNSESGIFISSDGSLSSRGGIEVHGNKISVRGFLGNYEGGNIGIYDTGLNINAAELINDASNIEIENGRLVLESTSSATISNTATIEMVDARLNLLHGSILDNSGSINLSSTLEIDISQGSKLIVRNGATFTSTSSFFEKLDINEFGELDVEVGGFFHVY